VRRVQTARPVATSVDISAVEVTPIPGGSATSVAPAVSDDRSVEDDPPAPAYVENEYLFSGVASTYAGPAIGPATVATTGTPFTTRIVVRLPADPTAFSGRVLIEPFNTSAGHDVGVVWESIEAMLRESGDAWIGVTVRSSQEEVLRTSDPTRYGDLDISSNDVEWDIIRQIGGLMKQGGDPSGYSQSGVDVATFATAMNELTRMEDGSPVYDGYLPAAHSGNLAPLQSGTSVVPSFESTPMDAVDAPVLDVQTQTDVEGFRAEIDPTLTYTSPSGASIRRPDRDAPDDKYRLYELAGAPHAGSIPGCDGGGSTFPTAASMRAATELLFRWAEEGVAPPEAARIELATLDIVSVAALDPSGNAIGGVPSPFLEVPLARYEVHSTPGAFCALAGRETPLSAADLNARYGTIDGYLDEFTQSLDATIDAGYLRDADRGELLDLARTHAETSFGA
jgi:hypothetical protein